MQPANARGNVTGPTAGAAAHVETFGIRGQLIPGEDGEVVAKNTFRFHGGHPILIKALPLIAEAGDSVGVAIGVCVVHAWEFATALRITVVRTGVALRNE